MQAHTVERVESWDSRPFPGGFRELQDLADDEFSGAVVADGTWLFALNGRVIGIYEGDIDDFADATGTVYEAPDPSVALLFSMQERGGETQAKYYTNDTPLSEAGETLEDANFTGYIELSENVLSGDYYVVYYGGRSMSAAFVGTSEELVTGGDAFERADDEVGVYEVKKVPVNVTSIPEPEDDSDSATGAATSTGAAASGEVGTAAGDSQDDAGASEDAGTTEESPVSNPGTQERGAAAEPGSTPEPASEAAASGGGSDSATSTTDATGTPDGSSSGDVSVETGTTANQSASSAAADSSGGSDDRESAGESAAAGTAAAAETAESEDGSEVFDEEEQWRNTNSVPTLDPSESESSGEEPAAANRKAAKTSNSATQQSKQQQAARSTSGRSQSGSSGGSASTVEKLKRAVKQRDAKLEEAKDRIEGLESEREDLRERVEALQQERDELQSRLEDVEAELEASGGSSEPSGRTMAPDVALSETNLFVRYGSKGKPTLDELGPEIDADAVNHNLQIEHHTQFDASEVTVDGDPFEPFLKQSTAYRFVSWVVRELPFEIRDSGHTTELADVYDAIPEIDRAELDGTVAVDTEEGSVSQTFDVVLRDRMGNPLLVAELNPEREPVTGDEMAALVDAATEVRAGADELSGALYVTASFFEPPALETAEEGTSGGGILSRSDKASYVNVGRKTGYHLCLVEDRNDAFHLTVPEL
jgi:hypothetical protein